MKQNKKKIVAVWILLICLLAALLPKSFAVEITPLIGQARDLATDNEWSAIIQINAMRQENGRLPLILAEDMQPIAALRASELDETFGPARPDGSAWHTALDKAGVRYTGASELIARPFVLGQQVVALWAADDVQRAVLLGDYTHMAIAHNLETDTWSAHFVQGEEPTALLLHPTGGRVLPAGASFGDLGILIEATGANGRGFIWLTDEMVTGIDTNQMGWQTALFTRDGQSVMIPIEIWFADVALDCKYYNYIRHVTETGLFRGVSPDTFDPEGEMTRAMFVTVLGRKAVRMGLPITGDGGVFEDVAANAWYTPYIGWAAARGIAEGYGGRFGVEDLVSREQMATFLKRFMAYIGLDLTIEEQPDYPDRDQVAEWSREAVDLAVVRGLLTVSEQGVRPRAAATRAEVARAMTVLDRDHIR